MKKLVTILTVALGVVSAALPSLASAAVHNNIGGGFHSSNAPLGVRWWMTGQKLAIDVGLGFDSDEFGDERLNEFTIEAGIPVVVKSWDRVHALFRPGIMFNSQDVVVQNDTDSATTFTVLLEGEAEVFLADNFSVSASHGLHIESFSPAGDGDSSTAFGLFGNDFTEVGFHLYLFGPAE